MALRTPTTLFQGRFTWQAADQICAGVVTLSRLKLNFDPRSFDPQASESKRTLSLADIDLVENVAETGQIRLRLLDGSAHVLAGDGAGSLANQLRELLREEAESSIQPDTEEEPILREEVELRFNSLLSTRAVCELYPGHLRIVQVPGLQARLMRVPPFQSTYQGISHLEMEGARNCVIGTSDHAVTIRGGAVARIYATVHAARVSGLENPGLRSAATAMAMATGPRTIPGFVAFGPSHFVFAPESVIDTASGAQIITMAWEDVTRAELRHGGHNLWVSANGQSAEFVIKTADRSWLNFKRLVRRRYPLEPVPGVGTRRFSEPMMASFLAKWALALAVGEQPLWLRFCFRLQEGPAVTPLWVLMTDRALYILPTAGGEKDGRRVPLLLLSSLRTWAEQEPTIRVMVDDEVFELEPPQGANDVARFWAICPLTSYQGPRDRPVSVFPMPKLEGAPHFLRMIVREREMLRISYPTLRPEKDGLVVLFAAQQRPTEGVPREAYVDIADGRGVFRFLGLLMGEGQDRSAEGNLRYFKLAIVTKPERVSKREEYRVVIDTPVTVLDEGQDQPVGHGQLFDVSGGGVGLNLEELLPDDRPVSVHFDVDGVGFQIRGTRVNSKRLGDPINLWQQGVQFCGDSIEEIARLRQVLIQRQRLAAVQEREGEEDLG